MHSPTGKRRSKPPVQGHLYLVENENYLKIGFTTNLKNRLSVLSRWPGELRLLKMKPGTRVDEAKLHTTLQRSRVENTGEWYKISRKEEILQIF